MKKILFFSAAALLSVSVARGQANIAAARAQATLSTVNIRGVVINGAELGKIRYVQDNTGGISVYDNSLSTVNRGDSIAVTGPLTDYKALLEISTTTLGNPTPVTFTALGTGVAQTPSVITPAQFGENVEGRLIKFLNVQFTSTGTFSSATNYTMTDGANTFVARITSSVSNLFGTPIPTGNVNIVGIGSQFCSAGGACATGYQLLPRDLNDITASVTGINEASPESKRLSVYPNPSAGKINFNLGVEEQAVSTQITDITGKVVYSSKDNSTSIDVSNLTNGIYSIKVITQKNNYLSKFTVSK
jgi:hypothetical protein